MKITHAISQRRPASLAVEKAAAVVGFALLTALAAQISVPLPGGVPMTLQTLAVALCATTLGGLGMASMALYLAFGALGAPVFAEQASGLAVVGGVTGGYLLGFVLAQPLGGMIASNGAGPWRLLIAALAVHAAVFAVGVPWFKVASGMPWGDVLMHGLWVFIPGTAIKCGLVAAGGGWPQRAAMRRNWR